MSSRRVGSGLSWSLIESPCPGGHGETRTWQPSGLVPTKERPSRAEYLVVLKGWVVGGSGGHHLHSRCLGRLGVKMQRPLEDKIKAE